MLPFEVETWFVPSLSTAPLGAPLMVRVFRLLVSPVWPVMVVASVPSEIAVASTTSSPSPPSSRSGRSG